MTVNFDSSYPTVGPLLIRESVALCIVTALMVALRLWQTYERRGQWGTEEGLVIAAMVVLIVGTAMCVQMALYGFGYKGEDISKAGGDIHMALKYFFVFQIIYKVNICLDKLAFLFLFLRIFPQQTFRRICWSTIAVVVVGTLIFLLGTIFECTPIANNWDKSIPAHCAISNVPFRWCWASFNTLTDLWICVLPLPLIWKLNMSLVKRLGTMLVFAVGLFVIAISCFRMSTQVKSVKQNTKHGTNTQASAYSTVWTHLEMAAGLIAVCLPSLKAPVERLFRLKHERAAAYTYGDRYAGRVRPSYGMQTFGTGDENKVQVSAMQREDPYGDNSSQEGILPPSAVGIRVQRDVSVRSGKLDVYLFLNGIGAVYIYCP